MCGYFCFEFTDFMLNGESFLEYTNLLSPNEYEINDKVISSKKVKMKKSMVLFVINIENLKTLKNHTFSKNIGSFHLVGELRGGQPCISCGEFITTLSRKSIIYTFAKTMFAIKMFLHMVTSQTRIFSR